MAKKDKVKISDTPIKTSVTVGEMLAQQRQKLGLSTEECAQSLKISEGKLAELETDDYSNYTSEIFVRGHLKKTIE